MTASASSTPVPHAVIVIPCYNEAARLPFEAFEAFIADHAEYRWCFVDDGSTDGTRAILERLCAAQPDRAATLSLPVNGGKAGAVRAGVLHALGAWPSPWVGYWDADLSTPLEELPRFLRYLEAHDQVRLLCGARWNHMGARIERHAWRHYIGRVFATAASHTLGMPIYDTQCGAKLIDADLARAVFEEPFHTHWVFDVEMIARIIRLLGRDEARIAIAEIPLEVWTDTRGSKVRLHHAFRVPLDFWRIHRRYFT